MAPAPLNVVCFRYRPATELADDALDALNEEILLQLQERGIAVPSGTRLGDRNAIRVANVNHRSRETDFEALVEGVVRVGRGLTESRER